jgi:hypothetical protein
MRKLMNDLNRRWILAGGAASGVLGVTGLSAQIASQPASNWKVIVTLNGATYTYPDGPLIPSYYVGFRPDGRIVFHLGALGDLTKSNVSPKPYHLGPHHVRVEEGGKVLLDLDIPAHWWNSEWTYRPAPIAARRTPAQIVAANRMFPYGDTGARVGQTANYVFKGPMDSAGITIYMPATGERPDIGLITDPSASYMLSSKPGPMLAWAQAAGSCPMHFRDEKTGQPIDLIKYPRANAMDLPGAGSPFLLKGPPNPDPRVSNYSMYGGGWRPQQAHYCEMSYLAHIATLDMGFLEDLQYSANFTVLTDSWISNQRGVATIYGELRGVAWAFRNLFMAHAATLDAEARGDLPPSCHPSSYFKKLLDNSLAYYSPIINDPKAQTFRVVGGASRLSPWMADYMGTALAFGVLTGHSDWTPLYLWSLGHQIARYNGTSGFPPGIGVPYRLEQYPLKKNADGTFSVEPDTTKPQLTWAGAFAELRNDPEVKLTQARYDALMANPLNGGKAMSLNESVMGARAVLVMADYLDKKGLAAVRATYPDLDTCLANVNRMFRAHGSVNPRVSIVV